MYTWHLCCGGEGTEVRLTSHLCCGIPSRIESLSSSTCTGWSSDPEHVGGGHCVRIRWRQHYCEAMQYYVNTYTYIVELNAIYAYTFDLNNVCLLSKLMAINAHECGDWSVPTHRLNVFGKFAVAMESHWENCLVLSPQAQLKEVLNRR